MAQKIRIMQFVTGGFSGATSVAIDLARAYGQQDNIESLLVFRQKKTTTADKLQKLAQEQIPYAVVSGVMHIITIYQLTKLCRTWKPEPKQVLRPARAWPCARPCPCSKAGPPAGPPG